MSLTDKLTAIETLKASKQGPHDLSHAILNTLGKMPSEGPFHFVNLLKFKSQATYPEGHANRDKGMTGQQAYNLYGAVAAQQVIQRGGRLMNSNSVKTALNGADWDVVATMEYQSIEAFLDMLLDQSYQAALVHREAGLEHTELLITRPKIPQPIGLSD